MTLYESVYKEAKEPPKPFYIRATKFLREEFHDMMDCDENDWCDILGIYVEDIRDNSLQVEVEWQTGKGYSSTEYSEHYIYENGVYTRNDKMPRKEWINVANSIVRKLYDKFKKDLKDVKILTVVVHQELD